MSVRNEKIRSISVCEACSLLLEFDHNAHRRQACPSHGRLHLICSLRTTSHIPALLHHAQVFLDRVILGVIPPFAIEFALPFPS